MRSSAALFTTATLCAVAALSVPVHAQTRPQSNYEIRFMTEMIDHHAMAIHMSEMCLTQAVHPELLAMCEQIIAAQTSEIQTMQSWLQSWYGVTYHPEMTPGMEQQMARMADMAGGEFEIAFMKSMIRHHWGAVVKAASCTERAYHPELIAMCGEMVEAQVAEITQLRTWLCDWYGVCNYGPKGSVGRR